MTKKEESKIIKRNMPDPNWWKDKADPKPIEIPAELKRPETIEEKIKRIIKTEISQRAIALGEESFEESEDFDIPDEEDEPITPYEMHEMTPEYPAIPGPLEMRDTELGDRPEEPSPAPKQTQKVFIIDGKKFKLEEVKDDDRVDPKINPETVGELRNSEN